MFQAGDVWLTTERALGGIFRPLVIFSSIRSGRNFILGPAVNLATKASGHMVGTYCLGGIIVNLLWLNLIAVEHLVILEVPGSDAAPGVRGAPDKGGPEGSLSLVHLGAC